jgi:hypothetical protein
MTKLADATAAWPSYSDDDGSGQTGTSVDKALLDAFEDSIDELIHSATNPTITPADNIDEVVTARGNKSSLNARIAGVIDADGALITPASLVSAAQLQSAIGAQNLLANEDGLMWSFDVGPGTTTVPDHWYLTDGGSGTDNVAREGTTKKFACAFAVDRDAGSSADTVLYQNVLNAAAFTTDFRAESFGLGCWVYTSIASHASIAINDGNDEEEATHTGAAGWEWLSLTHALDGAATQLKVELRVQANGTAYFCMPTLIQADYAPDRWIPSPRVVGSFTWAFRGLPTTGDDQRRMVFGRPTLLHAIQASCSNDPTGNFTIDVEKRFGGSWESLFAAGASNILGNGNEVGHLEFDDADLHTRCLSGWWPALGAQNNGHTVRLNIDAVNAGEDLILSVQGMQYCRPFEGHLAYNDIGDD